ncbi:MAG: hypothetical protein AB2A00_30915 [Myxococcota bacterium]
MDNKVIIVAGGSLGLGEETAPRWPPRSSSLYRAASDPSKLGFRPQSALFGDGECGLGSE